MSKRVNDFITSYRAAAALDRDAECKHASAVALRDGIKR